QLLFAANPLFRRCFSAATRYNRHISSASLQPWAVSGWFFRRAACSKVMVMEVGFLRPHASGHILGQRVWLTGGGSHELTGTEDFCRTGWQASLSRGVRMRYAGNMPGRISLCPCGYS
ncbi:MAG: hypothetical protein Q8N45_10835, partial [Anaerolineales bacterium]|nr:hypothetical protein [Anaerolineales bacterium]